MNFVGRLVPVFLLGGCLLVFGCNPPKPAPPVSKTSEHEHHESYADAVMDLDAIRLRVKEAMAAGDMEKADTQVHKVGHLLEELPELAAKDATASDESIKPAVDELFECFEAIDQKLEGGEGKTYDQLADRIDAAMATLKARIKAVEK